VDISWVYRHYFRWGSQRAPIFLHPTIPVNAQHAVAAGGDYTMRFRAIVSYLCVASLAGGLAIAAPPGQIRVQVNLVNLFATVRDKHKAIVTGLRQDDFQVYEDGQLQEITNFSAESNLPITLGILLDTSGSEYFMLSAEKEAGSRFLARVMRKGDLSMIMSFDTDIDLLADFTEDRGMLDRAINRAQINAPSGGITPGPLPSSGSGGTNFYDAVYLAAHDKLSGEAGRKAIIVLTDAEDTGSKLRLQDAIEAAQRTDTVVHILLVAADGGDQSVAKRLTDETGGRTIVVRNEKNLEQAFDQISEELRNQYTVGYYPSNKARDGSYRKIKMEMKNKDYSALTRRGYYAPNN
jgi:VWFA-related protein